ncbi:response regulator [Microvirga sp. 2MCAF38]|uniref:response regulator n=1 Tax=Microvirga sp. 2MCAF38 TaxID=3232989 RepID=UPI003F9B4426
MKAFISENLGRGTILVVDDEPDILVAIEDLFEDDYRVLTASSSGEALAILKREPDIAVILSDQRMPDMPGDQLLAKAGSLTDAQTILLTGYADLTAVISAVNKGRIMAYVPKPWDPIALTSMVASAYERHRLARELETERALLRGLMENSTDQISFKSPDGAFIRLNTSKAESLGASIEVCIGRKEGEFVTPEKALAVESADREAIAAAQPIEILNEEQSAEGLSRWIVSHRIPILGETGAVTSLATIERDVTERKLMEMRLRQTDKMQALGTLAGGVAHDFNNLLMAVLGSLDLASRRLPDDPRLSRLLNNAIYAAERGASLTQRLLSFSHQRDMSLRNVDVNEVVVGMTDLLTRTLGGMVKIERNLTGGLFPARVDPDQLELAILNLCINARDAMPEGGTITLSTRSASVKDGEIADLSEGDYVVVSVADTGAGIPPDVLLRVFEPFFTTKEVGKGTGLGLAMVYGLAQQSGGVVTIDSTIGSGTSVELYLSRASARADRGAEENAPIDFRAPKSHILLVDDNAQVRAVTAAYLNEMGHHVIEASGGAAALQIVASSSRIDLIVADFAMPEMTGLELADHARAHRPSLGVLLVTGYADPDKMPEGYPILTKPFSREDLAARLGTIIHTLNVE